MLFSNTNCEKPVHSKSACGSNQQLQGVFQESLAAIFARGSTQRTCVPWQETRFDEINKMRLKSTFTIFEVRNLYGRRATAVNLPSPADECLSTISWLDRRRTTSRSFSWLSEPDELESNPPKLCNSQPRNLQGNVFNLEFSLSSAEGA